MAKFKEHQIIAPKSPIVLFDGYCHLCSRTVDFILKHDTSQKFRFVALQSAEGEFLIKKLLISTVEDSVLLWNKTGILMRSAAVFAIAAELRFPFNTLAFFKILPLPVTDFLYRIIARNRTRFWGKRELCRMGNEPHAKGRFPRLKDLELEIATLGLPVE